MPSHFSNTGCPIVLEDNINSVVQFCHPSQRSCRVFLKSYDLLTRDFTVFTRQILIFIMFESFSLLQHNFNKNPFPFVFLHLLQEEFLNLIWRAHFKRD